MSYRTFEEWRARGRAVSAGEKAMGKLNDGTAIFGKEQTTKVDKPLKTNHLQFDKPDSWYLGEEYDYH